MEWTYNFLINSFGKSFCKPVNMAYTIEDMWYDCQWNNCPKEHKDVMSTFIVQFTTIKNQQNYCCIVSYKRFDKCEQFVNRKLTTWFIEPEVTHVRTAKLPQTF